MVETPPDDPGAGLRRTAVRCSWLGLVLAIPMALANNALDHRAPHVLEAQLVLALTGLASLGVLVMVWRVAGQVGERALFWRVGWVSLPGMAPAWFIATDYGSEVGALASGFGTAFAVILYGLGWALLAGIGAYYRHRNPRRAFAWRLAFGVGVTGGILLTAVMMFTSFAGQLERAADSNRTPLDIVVDLILVLLLGAMLVRTNRR